MKIKCVPGTEVTDVPWIKVRDNPKDEVASVPGEENTGVLGNEVTCVPELEVTDVPWDEVTGDPGEDNTGVLGWR